MCLLQVKLEHRPFKLPSGKVVHATIVSTAHVDADLQVIEMTTVGSSHHIEINPGDAGIYDRYVVQVGADDDIGSVLCPCPCIFCFADGVKDQRRGVKC